MIRSSISRPHQVNSPRIPSPRPALPSVPRRKLLARTNSPPPKTREKENERRESHSRATPSHSHKHTHIHFKVNTYLACANSYCHSGREICDFFHTHTQASKLNLNGACSFFSVFHTFTHMHRILVSLSLI